MSENDEGTPAEAGTPSTGTEDSGDALSQAFDLEPAPQGSEPQSTEGTPTEFDPSQLNVRTTSIDDIPEDLRSYYEPIYRLAHELEAGATKRDQDLQGQITAQKDAEAEWRNRIQELATGNGASDRVEDTLGEMTPERREGVEIVNKLIGQSLGPIQEQLSQVNQIAEVVQSMQQQSQSQETNRISGEVAEARGKYGASLDAYAAQITALVNVPNPVTGQPYTVTQAFELVSGKAQQSSQNMQAQDSAVRNDLKQRIGTPSTTPPPSNANPLSSNELRSQMIELGFEP
jgi:hypothetical protein